MENPRQRISYNDTIQETAIKMAQNNPDGFWVAMHMAIYEDPLKGYSMLLLCDCLGIYGLQLNTLWKYCDCDLEKVYQLLEDFRKNLISREELLNNLSQVQTDS